MRTCAVHGLLAAHLDPVVHGPPVRPAGRSDNAAAGTRGIAARFSRSARGARGVRLEAEEELVRRTPESRTAACAAP